MHPDIMSARRFYGSGRRSDPGGKHNGDDNLWRIIHRDTGGKVYAFHGVYHEVRSPERLVSTFEFEGTPGYVSLEITVFEERSGKTLLTSRSVFQSIEDRDWMLEAGMEEGLMESMDRLAELPANYKVEKKAA